MNEIAMSVFEFLSNPDVISAVASLFPPLLLVVAPLVGWLLGRTRAAFSFLVFALILDLGWWVAGWAGLLFLSLPAIFLYWLWLGIFSEFLLPHPPESGWWHSFKTLVGFAFGRNRPYFDVQDGDIQQRLGGNLIGRMIGPGLVLSAPHQAVALHNGFGFSRVAGPGLFFTRRYERILKVLNLRTHILKKPVDSVTKDGIPICILLFIPARIAKPRELGLYEAEKPFGCRSFIRMGANRIWRSLLGIPADEGIREGEKDQPLPQEPLYRFQRRQVFSVVRAQGVGSEGEHLWGDLVKDRVENAARDIIVHYPLDRLLTASDEPSEISVGIDSSASEQTTPREQVAEEILQRLNEEMKESGIEILGLGMANVEIRAEAEGELIKKAILEQRLESWQAKWKRRMLAEQGAGEADALREKEKARAMAQRDMMLAIAEGFRQLMEANTTLPTELVALRFIDVVEQMIDTPAMRSIVPADVVHTLDDLRQSFN